MESILEQLYNGEIAPYSKYKLTFTQLKEKRDTAYHGYDAFLNKLPDGLKKEFRKLIDEHLDLLPLEMEENFMDGFRIGVRLMAEVFAVPLEE